MRLFIGIPLAAGVAGEVAAIRARLQGCGEGLRWAAPESWHITLQFLGSTGPEQFQCVAAELRRLHLPAVPVCLEGLGFFERAGIFYAGVRLTPELLSLQQRVSAATRLCGFQPEARAYQPHITLARGKQGLRELKSKVRLQTSFSRFTAEEFLLYESFTEAGGSRYEVRERYPLHAGERGRGK